MTVHLTRRRFSVDEYHWMARVGILREDDRLELIDGEIIEMPPIKPGHSSATDKATKLFVLRFSDVAWVRIQNPIRLSHHSEPEPDVALVHQRADEYSASLQAPDDVFLVIEIADSTLATDRDVKLPMYAWAGIPEYWVLDLSNRLLRIHRVPSRGGYRETLIREERDQVAPISFPSRLVAVADLLPRNVNSAAE